jgi:hypothetical protein
MTPRERQIYNAGVNAALAQARDCANQIEKIRGYKVARAGFSVVALREFAEAGEALLVILERELKEQSRG